MRTECWITKATDNTLGIRNMFRYATAKTVTRTSLNVTFICKLPVVFRRVPFLKGLIIT